MNFNKVIFIIILLISTGLCKANPTVAMADSAYNSGDYGKAIALYQAVAEDNGVSYSLYYNLGNAYYQAGDLGMAMLSYQRAKKLNPSNKEINSNLNYLKEKIEDANRAEQRGKRLKVTEDDQTFFQGIHTSVAVNTSSDLWAGWAAAFFLIFAGCVALYLFTRSVLVRKFGFFGGMFFLGLSMIFIVFAYMGAQAKEMNDYGIITSYKVVLQTEPNTRKTEVGEILTRGTKIRIISEETDANGDVTWYKVRLNSDYIGWIPAEDLAVI